jgi:FAD/FMN-containing dehydrogenase
VYAEAAGIGQIMPAAVAVARSVEDVQAIVRWASECGIAITARGSGSSMGNGAIGAGVMLDVSRLAWIGDVDTHSSRVRCGPGAVHAAVDDAARRRGLRFPVDPSSGAFCTMGGMAATNAAGAHSLAFGPTRAWIHSLDCVLADGSVVKLTRGSEAPDTELLSRVRAALQHAHPHANLFRRPVRKDSSGYGIGAWLESGDLLDVIVGSEGTLAIIVGLELRLARVPAASTSVLAAFTDLVSAAAAAAAAREAGAAVCELLERTFLDLAGSAGKMREIPESTAAVLLIQLEDDDRETVLVRCVELESRLTQLGAATVTTATIAAEEREMWELRHGASPALARLDRSLRSIQVIEDAAVPPAHFADYVTGVRAALDRAGLRGVVFGHAGDGHLHVNPLVDLADPEWRLRLESLLTEVTALVATLGGTLTGEHGDGRLRAPLLAATWPAEAIAVFAALKRAFDPRGILNPGVKLPLAGQSPIEKVKYDPLLDPLPPAARGALDFVANERAYSALRLSLLDRSV